MRLEELKLSGRAYNCLRRGGIRTVEELRALPENRLAALRGLGYRSLCEIKAALKAQEKISHS